jgi:cytochrome c peroxidase
MKTLVSMAVLTAIFFSTYTCIRTLPNTRPEGVSELLQPLPEAPAQPAALVSLGKTLFFESRLSKSNLVSCNTCHSMSSYGVDHRARAIGEFAKEGLRNTPTVFNTVFLEGDHYSLEEVIREQLVSVPDMNANPDAAVARLAEAGYAPLFQAAFPGESEALNFRNVTLALAAFVRTLTTPDSKFDRYLRGDTTAMNASERRGLALFQRNGCVACHNGPMLGATVHSKFTHLQEKGMSTDFGDFIESGKADDQFVFRATPLRNVGVTYPYFHNGAVYDLKETLRIMGAAQLGFTLSDADVADMTAFLHTLTGRFPAVAAPDLPSR